MLLIRMGTTTMVFPYKSLYIWVKRFLEYLVYELFLSDLKFGEGLCIYTSFHFADSGLYLFGTVLIFILIYIEWRDTENQQ